MDPFDGGTITLEPKVYEVTFCVGDAICTIHAPSLISVCDGFWINEDMDITSASDAKYYVLSHMIKKIEKVPVHVQEED